ncbi:AGAP002692-PA-like protein [Anopheles sinensis]|uniref:AGAP002692-PA-like protein n=1 Tax=Anopheles sinensis TaxID=74873 RepID=A0A084WR86_ANOSI|nr:AGAP002692-PA-like protein [Anopheles sinensis]
MDDNSLQQLLSSGGPSRRRALHDRTATPTGPGGPSHTENIAIIIEDQVDEECLKTSEFGYRQDAEYQEEEEYTPMDVDDEKETSLEENYMVHTMAATAGDEEENVANVTEGDEIISVEDVTAQEVDESVVNVFDAIADQGEDGYEVMVDLDEEPEEASVEEDLGEYDDEEEEEEDEDVEDEGSYEDLEDELHNGELDNSAEEGDDDSVDSSSVLEVIDLSDEDNANTSSSSSSSSSSSGDPHGGAEQAQANTINPVADEPPQQQQPAAESVEPSVGSVGLQQQILYAELYSDAAPRVIYHQVHIEGEEDEEEKEGGGEQVQRREGDAQEGPASHDIQVPTTSSSTHRTEASGLADSSDDEDEVSEVKDLSVIGQNIAEVADSSMASGALRDRAVAGDQWEDGVASTSGNEEVVSARVVAPSSSGTTAAASVAAPGAQPQTQATQQQQTFGQPKNAHELEVPAMNLSVKPDEAHGSSRKNSKGEENGLSEEARALNLSAGQQQELAAQMARAEAGNNNDGEGEDEIPNVSNDEPHMHVEAQENEPHSSDEGKEVNEEERMDLTLHVSDEEDASEMQTPPTAGPSSTAEEPKQYSKEVENSPLRRSKETLLQQEETASTSTPRANVKTRLMIAMEKSSGTTPSLGTPTRARGRSGRSTSVVHETTDTPITSALSRSRRYASMDNVSEATPDPTVPLTPRRSTRRASSLAKELFAGGTPQKRTRRQSQSSVESADPRGSVPPTSPPDAAMEPPEPSEKSFASSTASSARRGRRGRKPRAASELPGTSGGSDAPLLADYSSNRRLTRHQLAVMEKSMEISSRSSQARMERGASSSKLDESIETGGADSEGESVVSNVSNQSSVRSTRSRTTRAATRRSSVETRSNRGGSVKDSSASHHPTAGASELDSDSDHSMVHGSQRTVHGLEPIAEEGDETRSETGKKRRGRPPKNRQ